MRRRSFLLASFAWCVLADAGQEIYDLFATMASGLSEGNAEQFLRAFDPAMPGYPDLAANVRALVQQSEVLSAIEVVEDKGDAERRSVQLDWLLQITGKQDSARLVRRQQIVKCRLEKQKSRWRIVGIEPPGFFAPPPVNGD